ncbi:hypothetical protein NQZ68_039234 [Dissostichus eleginoides]|nr:hypothetical protein NQZ68_039234 [Dissostichus eleginoides]
MEGGMEKERERNTNLSVSVLFFQKWKILRYLLEQFERGSRRVWQYEGSGLTLLEIEMFDRSPNWVGHQKRYFALILRQHADELDGC